MNPFVPFLTVQGTNGDNRTGISREAIWHCSDTPPAQGDLLATSRTDLATRAEDAVG